MKKTIMIPVGAYAMALALGVSAVDWPAAGAPLQSSFGQNKKGRPSVGLDFSGDEAVRSVDAGEVLFVGTGGERATDRGTFPFTLGDWIAIDHGNNIVTSYGHLQTLENQAAKTLVEKGSVLGRSGASGWAEEAGFYFSVLDRAERRWVNPAMLAPARTDTKTPVIRSVILVAKDGASHALPASRILKQGDYRIVVDAVDSENSSAALLAPQQIVCLINGQQQGSLHLETITAKEGELMVSRIGPTPATQAYTASGSFDLGEARLTRGRATIELIVRDSIGNERIAAYTLQIE